MTDSQDQFGSGEGAGTTSDPFGWRRAILWVGAAIVVGIIVIAVAGL